MPNPPPVRHKALMRSALSLVAGVVIGIPVGIFLGVAAGLLSGWAVLALANVTWVLILVWNMEASQTRAHAIADDPGRVTARFIATVGSVASLGAVVVIIIEARHAPPVLSFVLAGISVVSVAASWALIQVDYMLRYARIFYAEPVGGISFNQEEDPTYSDFAYFSVGLGMTYQVADTNVRSNEIRRIVIAQTLLAYMFGAVILATLINLVTGLG